MLLALEWRVYLSYRAGGSGGSALSGEWRHKSGEYSVWGMGGVRHGVIHALLDDVLQMGN